MKKFYTKRFSLICAFAASALLLGGGCSEDETEPAIGSKYNRQNEMRRDQKRNATKLA